MAKFGKILVRSGRPDARALRDCRRGLVKRLDGEARGGFVAGHERGALRSFLGETQYVSLAFAGTAAFFGYWIGQFIGRYLAVWPIRRYIKTL